MSKIFISKLVGFSERLKPEIIKYLKSQMKIEVCLSSISYTATIFIMVQYFSIIKLDVCTESRLHFEKIIR